MLVAKFGYLRDFATIVTTQYVSLNSNIRCDTVDDELQFIERSHICQEQPSTAEQGNLSSARNNDVLFPQLYESQPISSSKTGFCYQPFQPSRIVLYRQFTFSLRTCPRKRNTARPDENQSATHTLAQRTGPPQLRHPYTSLISHDSHIRPSTFFPHIRCLRATPSSPCSFQPMLRAPNNTLTHPHSHPTNPPRTHHHDGKTTLPWSRIDFPAYSPEKSCHLTPRISIAHTPFDQSLDLHPTLCSTIPRPHLIPTLLIAESYHTAAVSPAPKRHQQY